MEIEPALLMSDGAEIEVDHELMNALVKSVPLEPGYDDMAVAIARARGKPVANLLKTRRERCHGQFRPKKDRFEKWEKLDDLYFSLCDFLHAGLPDRSLYWECVRRFKPGGIATLTLELVNDMPWRIVCNAEDKITNYDIAVLQGRREAVCLKSGVRRQTLDLRALYALAMCLGEDDAELARALMAIGEEELLLSLLPKNLLRLDALDDLWSSGNIRIMRKLLSLPEFENALSDEQVALIMAVDDYSINISLGACQNVGKDESGRRISSGVLKELKNFILRFRAKNGLASLA